MDFAPIVPTSVLSKYLNPRSRKTWFALAHVEDLRYRGFYASRPDDVTLILDNGAYEGQLNISNYSEAITWYRPTVAVLPDLYLAPSARSFNLSFGFLEIYRGYQPEWMFVPQAEPGDEKGFINIVGKSLEDPRIKWIGLPRCTTTHISNNPLFRCNIARAIRDQYPEIKIHALGMSNGNVHELYYLQAAGVRSCDSSAPYWRKFNLDDDIDFDYDEPLDLIQRDPFEEVDACLSIP